MRIYRSQVPKIAQDAIVTLRASNDIEVEEGDIPEAIRDVAAVIELYLKTDYEIVEQAKNLVDTRGLTSSDLGRVKRELCERRGHPTGEEGIRWVISQIVEGFMISRFVSEVYTEDTVLKRKLMDVFKKHLIDDALIDREVRERMKNLQEGTSAWGIQYQKILREVRRKHGLA